MTQENSSLLVYDEKTLRDDTGKRIFRNKKTKDFGAEFALSLGPKTASKGADSFKKCESLLNMLFAHRCAEPFKYPVDPVALGIPDYPLIIEEPMDLSTVRQKLKNREYPTPSHMLTDVRKIWANSFIYNKVNSQMNNMTADICDYFQKIQKEVIENPYEEMAAYSQARSKDRSQKDYFDQSEGKVAYYSKTANDKPLSYEEKRSLTEMVKSRPGLSQICPLNIWAE